MELLLLLLGVPLLWLLSWPARLLGRNRIAGFGLIGLLLVGGWVMLRPPHHADDYAAAEPALRALIAQSP
jgi:hypothetical protein